MRKFILLCFLSSLFMTSTLQAQQRSAKTCPGQWENFENAVRLERQQAADKGASYYISHDSREELIQILLGNPYVEPYKLDHLAPVVDDEISIWVTHESEPRSGPREVWSLGYKDPNNIPGKQFSRTAADLGAGDGLFLLEVRYRNIDPPDHHVFVRIGGPGMCGGSLWCDAEIRSFDGTNRTLKSARIWRSVLKPPDCTKR
jgi:hypothetical protein